VTDQYQALMDAIVLLKKAQERQPTIMSNPAWVMLLHATQYLSQQAEAILRDGRDEQ
jgi:hypothetical protein